MKNSLSSRHKRTNRLLKYLINGDIKEDQLHEMTNLYYYTPDEVRYKSFFEISSYVIKTLIIYHHYSCKNNDILTESHCVIDVSKALQSYGVEFHYYHRVPRRRFAAEVQLFENLPKNFQNLQVCWCHYQKLVRIFWMNLQLCLYQKGCTTLYVS